MTLVTASVAQSRDDTATNAFQAVNAAASSFLIFGNIFLGINGDLVFRFAGHGIPRGSVINSARCDFTAALTQAGAVSVQINSVSHTPPQAWKPKVGFTGWRRDFWTTFRASVRNPSNVAIINTVTTSNSSWEVKAFQNIRERLAQRFVPGSSDTLGSVVAYMQRIGSPVGDVTLEIHSSAPGDYPTPDTDPSETVLATSEVVSAGSLPTALSNVTFSFTGANQIALDSGTTYYAVLRSTHPPSITNYIRWASQRQFFGPGGAKTYSTSQQAWGAENYPGVASAFLAARAVLGTNITWAVPSFVLGNSYSTPDLSALIQATVDDPNYATGDPISIVLQSTGNTGQRRIAAFDHATLAPANLVVDFMAPSPPSRVCADLSVTRRVSASLPVSRRVSASLPVNQRILA